MDQELEFPAASCRESRFLRLEHHRIRSRTPLQAAGKALTPEFKKKFMSLQAKGDSTTFLGVDIVRKLNDWFTNHIYEVDKKMGAFLTEKMPHR